MTALTIVLAAGFGGVILVAALILRALRHIANDLCQVGAHFWMLNEMKAEHDEMCRACDPDHDWSDSAEVP